MRVFHYYGPGQQEQRSFAMLFLGSLLAVGLAVALAWRTTDVMPKAVLLGAVGAILFRLGSTATELEKRAQRAQHASIELHDDRLEIVHPNKKRQSVAWGEITKVDVAGGRLKIVWEGGSFLVGSREVDGGMQLTQEILGHYQKTKPPSKSTPLFIPLEPK